MISFGQNPGLTGRLVGSVEVPSDDAEDDRRVLEVVVHRRSDDFPVSIGDASAASYPYSWSLAELTLAQAARLHDLLGATLDRARELGWIEAVRA